MSEGNKRQRTRMPAGSAWASKETIFDPKIKGNTFHIYMSLCVYANIDTDETFVSQETLSECTGLSAKTVSTSIKLLVELGYIEKLSRGNKTRGGRTTNLYRIINKPRELNVNSTSNLEEGEGLNVNSTSNSEGLSVNSTSTNP
jgi:biotin operon repressor